MLTLFAAINQRWHSTDLADNFTAVSAGSADPRAVRPYAVVVPLNVLTRQKSNKGRYADERFDVQVIADTFEQASELATLVQTRLEEGPLVLASDRLLMLEAGQLHWQEEDQFWKVIIEFTASVAQVKLPI